MSNINPNPPRNIDSTGDSINKSITKLPDLSLPPLSYDFSKGESNAPIKENLPHDAAEWIELLLNETQHYESSTLTANLFTAFKPSQKNLSQLQDSLETILSKNTPSTALDLTSISINKASPSLIQNFAKFSYIPFAVLYSLSLNQQIE